MKKPEKKYFVPGGCIGNIQLMRELSEDDYRLYQRLEAEKQRKKQEDRVNEIVDIIEKTVTEHKNKVDKELINNFLISKFLVDNEVFKPGKENDRILKLFGIERNSVPKTKTVHMEMSGLEMNTMIREYGAINNENLQEIRRHEQALEARVQNMAP